MRKLLSILCTGIFFFGCSEKEKIEVVRQGWFQREELSIYEHEPNVKIAAKMLGIGFPLKILPVIPTIDILSGTYYRLEGWKKYVSN